MKNLNEALYSYVKKQLNESEKEKKLCPNCGYEPQDASENYCRKCGTKLQVKSITQQDDLLTKNSAQQLQQSMPTIRVLEDISPTFQKMNGTLSPYSLSGACAIVDNSLKKGLIVDYYDQIWKRAVLTVFIFQSTKEVLIPQELNKKFGASGAANALSKNKYSTIDEFERELELVYKDHLKRHNALDLLQKRQDKAEAIIGKIDPKKATEALRQFIDEVNKRAKQKQLNNESFAEGLSDDEIYRRRNGYYAAASRQEDEITLDSKEREWLNYNDDLKRHWNELDYMDQKRILDKYYGMIHRNPHTPFVGTNI